MSIHMILTADINKIERQTYDLLDYLGDIGGLIEIIYYSTRALIMPFAAMRIKALLVNRLYHLSVSTKQVATDLKKLHLSGLHNMKVHSNGGGFHQLAVPGFLDWQYLRYKCCKAICRHSN